RREGAAPLLPVRAAVGRAVEAGRAGAAAGRLDDGVDDVGALGRDGEADAPHLLLGEAGRELLPARPAVGRLVDGALRAAVDERPDVAPPLVGGGIEDVGVPAVHDEVGDAGVLAHVEDPLPALAAVGRLVEAAVAPSGPQRPLGGDVDGLSVPRVD